jgi:hypothetical protein|tara:strand:+ start:69 stop:347 length:279 start_codon:yes stop_codon:yes gene_type:complete
VEIFTGNPFSDSFVSENRFKRVFDEQVDNSELIWHKDKEDRVIYVIESNSWKIQYDNQLPIDLVNGNTYYVKKENYHRVHKGKGNLVIEIQQ